MSDDFRNFRYQAKPRVLRSLGLAYARLKFEIDEMLTLLNLFRSSENQCNERISAPSFILLVAGEEFEYRAARAIIERHGIHTLVAGEAEAAKQLLAEFTKIDGILIWPNMSSSKLFAFVHYMRWRHAELPIVMVSTEEQLDGIPPAFATILTAPFDFVDVAGAFERAGRHKPVLSIVQRSG